MPNRNSVSRFVPFSTRPTWMKGATSWIGDRYATTACAQGEKPFPFWSRPLINPTPALA